MLCEGAFGWINRKHHCRNCGIVVCSHCSPNKQYIAAYQSMQRVCKKCFRIIRTDTEEMEVLYAEMDHVSALRSVEIGKKVQLEQRLSCYACNMAVCTPEVERLETLLIEQERRADGKQVRYDQLYARLRHLQNVLGKDQGLLQRNLGPMMANTIKRLITRQVAQVVLDKVGLIPLPAYLQCIATTSSPILSTRC